jgi:hypothetical protein
MRGGIFSKNIWEGASERRNENIIVWDPKNSIFHLSSNGNNPKSILENLISVFPNPMFTKRIQLNTIMVF